MKKAEASPDILERIFSVPHSERATLYRLEKELSENLDNFLRKSKVAGEIPLKDLALSFASTALPEHPRFVADHVDYLLKQVIPYCVNTGSPRFIGHMTSALPYFLISLSKCMVALHQNVVKIETSRALTLLERQVLGILHRLVYARSPAFYRTNLHNRHTTLGVLGSGGTSANITALWTFRNRFVRRVLGAHADQGFFEALRQGGYRGACFFVSSRGHYSFRKAADLLGLGQKNCIQVAVTPKHRINLVQLENAIARAKSEGLLPLAICGIAGSTETGSVDPLDRMADIAAEHDLPLHVDAAWGGPLLFSNRHSTKLKGIERADSVVFDGHKQLYLPMGTGMLLFKDPDMAKHIEQSAHYIIRSGSFDLGKRNLEGSRAGMALLVHAGLFVFGRKGYELLMDLNLKRARLFASLIKAHPHFELVTAPELNILTYRYNPWPGRQGWEPERAQELGRLNVRLQKIQRERGQSFVSRTSFRHPEPDGPMICVLRSILANPRTRKEDLVAVLEEQVQLAREIITGQKVHYPLLIKKLIELTRSKNNGGTQKPRAPTA